MKNYRSVRALAACACLSLAVSHADAQMAFPNVGDRVRLRTTDELVLTGMVLAAGPDTLRLLTDKTTEWTFLRSQVRGYDVSAGRSYAKGIGWGAAIGAAIGAGVIVWGEISSAHHSDATFPAYAFTVPAALATTILGAGIGALAAPEQWRSQVGLGVRVSPGSASIGMRIVLEP